MNRPSLPMMIDLVYFGWGWVQRPRFFWVIIILDLCVLGISVVCVNFVMLAVICFIYKGCENLFQEWVHINVFSNKIKIFA